MCAAIMSSDSGTSACRRSGGDRARGMLWQCMCASQQDPQLCSTRLAAQRASIPGQTGDCAVPHAEARLGVQGPGGQAGKSHLLKPHAAASAPQRLAQPPQRCQLKGAHQPLQGGDACGGAAGPRCPRRYIQPLCWGIWAAGQGPSIAPGLQSPCTPRLPGCPPRASASSGPPRGAAHPPACSNAGCKPQVGDGGCSGSPWAGGFEQVAVGWNQHRRGGHAQHMAQLVSLAEQPTMKTPKPAAAAAKREMRPLSPHSWLIARKAGPAVRARGEPLSKWRLLNVGALHIGYCLQPPKHCSWRAQHQKGRRGARSPTAVPTRSKETSRSSTASAAQSSVYQVSALASSGNVSWTLVQQRESLKGNKRLEGSGRRRWISRADADYALPATGRGPCFELTQAPPAWPARWRQTQPAPASLAARSAPRR